jgi:uridine kinase
MKRPELINELASRIAAVCRDHPVRVAIDGVDASGKTTLADELVTPLQHIGRSVIRASLDGFHNPAPLRGRRGAASAEGYYHDSFNYTNVCYERLLSPREAGPRGSIRSI